MKAKLRLTGNQDVDRVLRGLPLQVNHKVLQSAHTSAAKKTVDTAKLIAPEGPTGRLIDSIGVVKAPFAKASELGQINVGPRRGRYKGFAAHLVEYGTVKRSLKGKGKYKAGTNRGIMPKGPFMITAWNRTSELVRASINDHLGRHLYNFMKRTIKKGR